MKTRRGRGLPTPKTVCVRVVANSVHSVHAATSRRITSSAARRVLSGALPTVVFVARSPEVARRAGHLRTDRWRSLKTGNLAAGISEGSAVAARPDDLPRALGQMRHTGTRQRFQRLHNRLTARATAIGRTFDIRASYSVVAKFMVSRSRRSLAPAAGENVRIAADGTSWPFDATPVTVIIGASHAAGQTGHPSGGTHPFSAQALMGIPQIVIVGRPNVGKSSLFNWLVGKRLAIVDDVAGVTRDRVTLLDVRRGSVLRSGRYRRHRHRGRR